MSKESINDLWIAEVLESIHLQVDRTAATRLDMERFMAGLQTTIVDAATERFGEDNIEYVIVKVAGSSTSLRTVHAWSRTEEASDPWDELKGDRFDEATGEWTLRPDKFDRPSRGSLRGAPPEIMAGD